MFSLFLLAIIFEEGDENKAPLSLCFSKVAVASNFANRSFIPQIIAKVEKNKNRTKGFYLYYDFCFACVFSFSHF